jgi:hypothetical protein
MILKMTTGESTMEDERCCGTGTCIINPEGYCWCGQKWDGEKMSFPDCQPPAKVCSQPEQTAQVPADGTA